jgi:hypothetical protein
MNVKELLNPNMQMFQYTKENEEETYEAREALKIARRSYPD